MKITEALLRDHKVFNLEFEDLERALESGAEFSEIESQLDALSGALDTHAQLEDELLYAALEPHLGLMGPLGALRTDHGAIEDACSTFRRLQQQDKIDLPESTDSDTPAEVVTNLLEIARLHFAKEEQVLFPMAEELLDLNTLEQLGAQFTKRRRAVMI